MDGQTISAPGLIGYGLTDKVTVEGFVDDDLVIELYATRIIGQNGDVVTIFPGDG